VLTRGCVCRSDVSLSWIPEVSIQVTCIERFSILRTGPREACQELSISHLQTRASTDLLVENLNPSSIQHLLLSVVRTDVYTIHSAVFPQQPIRPTFLADQPDSRLKPTLRKEHNGKRTQREKSGGTLRPIILSDTPFPPLAVRTLIYALCLVFYRPRIRRSSCVHRSL